VHDNNRPPAETSIPRLSDGRTLEEAEEELAALRSRLESAEALMQRHERMLRWTQLMLKHHERMLRRRLHKAVSNA
jgi:hypothetical protein